MFFPVIIKLLDSSREYDPTSTKRKIDALDFDTLLKQAQRNLKR